MDDAVLLPQRNGHLGALRRCHADPVGVRAHLRQKGGKHEVVATYDAEFRAGFERQITGWATDFMRRSHQQGKPFYLYLPYTQTHIPTIPDPEYVGRTKRGNWADILTQMDDFTGQILDELHTLGLGEDTIVVWASDNGGDSTYRMPAGDPDPFGGSWDGFGRPWRGSLFTSLEGSNRTPCIIRWPGRCRPTGSPTNWCTRSTCSPLWCWPAAGACPPTG